MLGIEERAGAYVALSHLLQRPSGELRGLVGSLEFGDLWERVATTYCVEFPQSWLAGNLPELDEWDKMWNVVMGPVHPLVEPIESLYKAWTTDPSCESPLANQKGYLMSDWACHMEALFEKSGLEIPPQFAHCPDHLVLLLEFASILVEQADGLALLKFARHHFDWLEDLCEAARAKNAPPLYQDLYGLCLEFVKADERMVVYA
ncbi:MAG: molecular chaperone TorD family protein [Clostridiales bacterium]|jgi:hypothetical protein|nr:molecular chaperone TorD family protein [Clostridiales bacterium]